MDDYTTGMSAVSD